MNLIDEFHTSSIYSFINEGHTTEEIQQKVFNELNYTVEEFENYDDLPTSDQELIYRMLIEQYPEKQYHVLVDFIEDNTGSFHIRIWR